MRTMTDEKRQAIVAAAWAAFREKGFEATAVGDVAERIRSSKATIYRYFRSKDDLFAAALEAAMRDWIDAAFARLAQEDDLPDRLMAFADLYLTSRTSADMIQVNRALIDAAERSPISASLWAGLIAPQWRRLAATLEGEMAKGGLRPAEPYVAAMHFRGLIEADLVEQRLHGAPAPDAEAITTAARLGVEAFLRAYAPA